MVVAWVIERFALRHLVNQEPIALLMATLGIAYLLDGLGPMVFGSAVYSINVGMPRTRCSSWTA
ncbi:ABC transporter permease [Alicycliphilus sp. B1]|nr:ABC transporter permease [Alicycliphilus sp. B1]